MVVIYVWHIDIVVKYTLRIEQKRIGKCNKKITLIYAK